MSAPLPLPASAAPATAEAPSEAPLDDPDVFELLLRQRDRADAVCADPASAAALLPRLMAVGVVGVGAFALAQGLILGRLPLPHWLEPLATGSLPWRVLVLFAAYELGLMGAHVAALPSWYFYALLTGIRTHGWRLAVEAMRARATAALALLGILPVYLAGVLGLSLLVPEDPHHPLHAVLVLATSAGFALPFVAGLAAPAGLLRTLLRLAEESDAVRPEASRRKARPWLMAFAWTVLFASMAPLGVGRALVVLTGLGGG